MFKRFAGKGTRDGNGLTLVALLYINEGRAEEFDRFETAAAEIMRAHGGRLERRIVFAAREEGEQPDEIHIVTFPDQRAFQAYRGDARMQALGELRAAAIRRTVVWFGTDRAPFGMARRQDG